ncbi:MAG: abortive infection system antitoxin AbiGi family protein [Bacteroidales bacterium]
MDAFGAEEKMPVNTNTLIHFTDSINTMRLILMNDFYPRMSLEDYGYILNENEIGKIALPMICFCDIPLHLISSHMEEYGHFGIGLKKKLGYRKWIKSSFVSKKRNVPK